MVNYITYALNIAVVYGAFYLLRRLTRRSTITPFLWLQSDFKLLAETTVPYAPGPKKQFILGNVREFPVKNLWETFASWRSKYGVYCNSYLFAQIINNLP